MAKQRGGYRRPNSPAPVSGPGSMSRRTDGRQPVRYMSGGPYGEGQDMVDLQSSAPMSEAPAATPRPRRGSPPPMMGGQDMQPTPLFAPTQRPDEPLTAGASFGPGPSPQPRMQRGSMAQTLAKLADFDDTGRLQQLLRMAERRGW